MKEKKVAIQLKNITKSYTLKHEKPTLTDNFFSSRNSIEKFISLNKLDLTIHKGEKIGIIGANGAGKTTLLKIIAGITTPNTGSVLVEGRVVSLINLSAGFHPELTGNENIYLSGLLVGMSKYEITQKYEQIVRFSGIRKFIDAPLYTYSSGMKLRLGFSVAVYSNPDILIIDEGVSAGDENFRKKVSKKIQSFFTKNKTIIIVSHWLRFLGENCDRILWLKNGKVYKDGTIKILNEYSSSYSQKYI